MNVPLALQERGSAVLVALWTLLLAGVAAATLAELGRLATLRARLDRDGVRAWFLAEAGLAETVAAIAPGNDFTASLVDAPGPVRATGPPWSYAAGFVDDADEAPADPARDANGRVRLQIAAFGPAPVRRRLEAIVERDPDGLFPGAATLAGGVRELAADFQLDGRNYGVVGGCTMLQDSAGDRAGLAMPEGIPLPVVVYPDQINGRGGLPSIARALPLDLTSLGASAAAVRLPSGPLPAGLGVPSAPSFTIVDGDASVDGVTAGNGVLYVTGRLSVSGTLGFTGIVAAAGGVDVASTGHLTICGAMWAAGDAAFDTRGTGSVRSASEAIRAAARLAPLPAPARVIATAEIS